MTDMQQEPNREVVISDELRLYVSDTGCLVIEQQQGDTAHVVFDPSELKSLIAAINALSESAAAKFSAVHSAIDAEYQAWVAAGGEGDPS